MDLRRISVDTSVAQKLVAVDRRDAEYPCFSRAGMMTISWVFPKRWRTFKPIAGRESQEI
jgi:hypothetical protein